MPDLPPDLSPDLSIDEFSAAPALMGEARELEHLLVRGAREHNLKNVNVTIPKKKLVVFTGVSGSGKSSLAFDTIFAEGQRRYVESLSAYARQFLGQMEKPRYESIRGLSPTISIEQKAASKNPRSTVGTITEIYDYLRVLYARVGEQRCHQCGRPVEPQSAQQIVEELERLPPGTRFLVLAPVIENRKGEHRELLEELRSQGFARLRVNGEIVALDEDLRLDKKRRQRVEVVVDRLVAKAGNTARLTDSVETALRRAEGKLLVSIVAKRDARGKGSSGDEDRFFSEVRGCADCGLGFPDLSPQSFSFNSPLGMCPDCNGLGTALEIDPERVVPDPDLSIRGDAIRPWRTVVHFTSGGWSRQILHAVGKRYDIDLDAPFKSLSDPQRHVVLHGSGDEEIEVDFTRRGERIVFKTVWEGVVPNLMRRWKETSSEETRRHLTAYFSNAPCRTCRGQRLRPESSAVFIGGKSIVEVNQMTIAEAHSLFANLSLQGNRALIGHELIKEICGRLGFLLNVGLDYLSINRPGPSLSGGESQRIRLASQMGSELTGVLYILDEPSIGLHPRDNRRLIATLEHLRDLGNSVIVVEHDADMMSKSDWIVDFGPGAGRHGGEVVISGPPAEVVGCPTSLTGRYLAGDLTLEIPERRRVPDDTRGLTVRGARANNLKRVDATFPVGLFTCVTGVSGAGKSTLVNDVLYPAAARVLNGASTTPGPHDGLDGLSHFDKVIDIDQTPIGRTPRSNPATYTKVWDDVRGAFANTREARAYGFDRGRFSFNVKGGRCEHCEGAGVTKVEMHFLADMYVTCEICNGKRFNAATLRVRYRDNTITDLLRMTINEAAELFVHHKRISRILKTLQDVGLGYLHLGQPSTTLSGGEAQRVKLSRELARVATGRTLYILDEPSTGLHFEDIRRLLGVIQRLVEAGNTVIMIEHNLDIIKTADWIVDLGPEGGDQGGAIVACGPPETVARTKQSYTGRFLARVLRSAGSADSSGISSPPLPSQRAYTERSWRSH